MQARYRTAAPFDDRASSDQACGMTPSTPPYPVEIRKSVTIYVVGTVLVGGLALVLGGQLVRAAWLGRMPQEPSNAIVVVVMLAAITGWSLWNALDRRVRIRLTADGFHDLRQDEALVPWSLVRSVTIGQSDTIVIVMKDGLPGRTVDIRALDMSGRAIIDYAKRAAPHVEENVVDLLDLVRGKKG
jgi:hypothetical protein